MAPERGRQLLLGVLVVVLAIAIYRIWPATSGAPATASNRQGPRRGTAPAAQAAGPTAPEVHLDALDSAHPKPAPAERDLFRFKPTPPPSPPPATQRPPAGAGPTPGVPSGPPPPPSAPPIALRFIGVIESPEKAQKIAVLTDGRGAPFYGKEGEVVEGRYRILKIGVESIEIAYADGRGRQTIRLTGQ